MHSRRLALTRLTTAAACVAAPALAPAVQRPSLADPFRLAVDRALADSGLAAHLQRSFGRDTGVAVRLLPGPARELLSALGRGEHDGALLNTPQAEAELERLGLLRDRRQVASVDFVIVGPTALRPGLDALQARAQAARALAELVRIGAPFVGAAAGSGTGELEAVLWRAAQVAPQAPWYRSASAGTDPLIGARAAAACTLVERGVWAAAAPALRSGRDYGILIDGDPLLRVPVHAMRSFHGDHPAGKLWMNWLASAPGQRAIATLPAYRATPP